jgi:ribose transport system substrate-binding protein
MRYLTPEVLLRRTLAGVGAAIVAVATLAGCYIPGQTTTAPPDQAAAEKADQALKELEGQVLSKGPNGEDPAKVTAADLTPEQLDKIKTMKATAAIVMHYAGNDWATAQIAGLRSEFKNLGIEVVAVTDANFKPDKQVSDLETVMSKKPNIIVSIPTDPVATATAYKAAAAGGAKLVFMDNVPKGFKAGTDYVSAVSADNYGNGVVSAHLMAKALGAKGKIGLIFHEADFFVTRQRYEGFKKTVQSEYPEMQIVEEQGIAGPDFAGDAQGVANAMISKHSDLAGIWAVWDVPAEGVMAAARGSGRGDLRIATEDLGKNVAIALAKGELVVGLGAQLPYDQGVTEARLGALAVLGEKTPPYVALSALPVQHDNVLEAWKTVYHEDPPEDLVSSFK